MSETAERGTPLTGKSQPKIAAGDVSALLFADAREEAY